MNKRAFIYIRVSTREQAEEGYSVGEQEERLKKYCEAMEWQVVKVYIDPGFSGSNMERPALKEMIREIEKGKADIVLVDKLDRLSRSQFDTLYLINKVFTAHDCAFVSRAEAFDTSSSFGRAMVGILAVFAELERERIKERMSDGKEGRAKEGLYKGGGFLPIGFDYDKETGILIPLEYEAMQLREAAELFIERTPLSTIARILNNKGYRTRYGEWKEQTLRSALRNVANIGMISHKGNIYKGQHKPIMTEEMFDKILEIFAERDKKNEKYKPGKRYSSPLGGLIWCSHCGAKYHWRTNGKNQDGSRRSYYMCYSRSKSDPRMVRDPQCKNKNYRDYKLEEIIFDEIRKLKSDTSYIDSLRKSVDTSDTQHTLEKRIEQIDDQVSRLMDMYSIGAIDFDKVREKIETLQEEKDNLDRQLDDMHQEEPTATKEEIIELVDAFEIVRKSGDCYALHAAVADLIEHIEIDGEDIKIYWNF